MTRPASLPDRDWTLRCNSLDRVGSGELDPMDWKLAGTVDEGRRSGRKDWACGLKDDART